MLSLGPTDSLVGVAGTGSAIVSLISGDEISAGVDTFSIKNQSTLTTSSVTLYTPGTGKSALIRTWIFSNVTASPVAVSVYINGVVVSNYLCSITVPAFGYASLDDTGFVIRDGNGALVTTTPLAANSVTNAYLAQMAAHTFKGNNTAGTANALDLTATQLTAELDLASSSLKGLLSAADKATNDARGLSQVWLNDKAFTGGTVITNGTNSAVAAINAAVAALPAAGGIVWVSPGSYLIDSTVTIAKGGVRFIGLNKNNCVFTTNSATINMFTINEWFVGFEFLTFDATVTRTAGYAINAPAAGGYAYPYIRQCRMNNQFNGVLWGGTLGEIDGLDIRTSPGAGVGVTVQGSSDRLINNLRYDNASITAGSKALWIDQCASLILTNANLIHADIAFDISPSGANTAPSIEATNCFFDTSNIGVRFAGTGSAFRSKFTNCWMSSHTLYGVHFNNANTDGITFVNCDFYGNGSRGIYAQAVAEFAVFASRFAGNTTAGIETVAAAAMQFMFNHNVLGPTGAFGANGTAIIIGAGSYTSYSISDNDVRGNTTAGITDSGTVATTDLKVVTNNIGHLIKGVIASLAAATTIVPTTDTAVLVARIPANSVGVGQIFKTKAILTSLNGIGAAITWKVHVGAAGTTADAVAYSGQASAGITTGMRSMLDASVVVRSIGGAGTVEADGYAFTGTVVVPPAIAAAATATAVTTAAWFITISVTSSQASGAQIQQAWVEAA